tara:strand:- start:12 stop:326 length:315 start_codon:yes stop_codon:yes gene_type:complete
MKSFSKIKNKFLKRKIEKQHRQEILGKFTHEKRNHLLELKKLVREHERHDKKIIQAAMKEDVFQDLNKLVKSVKRHERQSFRKLSKEEAEATIVRLRRLLKKYR